MSLRYILITPAYNEEAFIDKTLQSMTMQTILPVKWVVVSDGSTDKTDDIVKNYKSKYSWIEHIRLPEHVDRNFAAKVRAFNEGYMRVRDYDYDIIGNLDADITFEKGYMEFLLNKFAENLDLGVAGTPFIDDSFQGYNYNFTNIEHVSGACQLFRNKCFEEIGGYIPIKAGGIDWVAVTTARMKGWKTKTYTDKTCYHHRKIGTADSYPLGAAFRYGQKDYYLGWHPLWEIFRGLYQMQTKPRVIGGLLLLCGYFGAFLNRAERPVDRELIDFHRREQMARLKAIWKTKVRQRIKFKKP